MRTRVLTFGFFAFGRRRRRRRFLSRARRDRRLAFRGGRFLRLRCDRLFHLVQFHLQDRQRHLIIEVSLKHIIPMYYQRGIL